MDIVKEYTASHKPNRKEMTVFGWDEEAIKSPPAQFITLKVLPGPIE